MELNIIEKMKQNASGSTNSKYHKYINAVKAIAEDGKITAKEQSDIQALIVDIGLSFEQLTFDVGAVKLSKHMEQLIADAPQKLNELNKNVSNMQQLVNDKQTLINQLTNEVCDIKEVISGYSARNGYTKYNAVNEAYASLQQSIPYHSDPLLISDILHGDNDDIRGWDKATGIPIAGKKHVYRNDGTKSATAFYDNAVNRIGMFNVSELNDMLADLFKINTDK